MMSAFPGAHIHDPISILRQAASKGPKPPAFRDGCQCNDAAVTYSGYGA